MDDWPKQSEVSRFYGEMGQNQVLMQLPYPMRVAWKPQQVMKEISIHELCHDSARRALKEVLGFYGPDEVHRLGLDLFGGCFCVRKTTNGTAWSMHSWGIAIDFDPARNMYKWGRDRAVLAQPEYEVFWQVWEAEGWLSLGRARNFDWMHVQAARLG